MAKKEVEICNFCNKEIDFNDKHVLLGTYVGDDALEEKWFHFKCFNEWHNLKVSEKAENTVKQAQQKVGGMLKGLMENLGMDVEQLKENLKKETDLDLDLGV